MARSIVFLTAVVMLAAFSTGCMVVFQSGRRSDTHRIDELSQQVDELSKAKEILESRLQQEIGDSTVQLDMQDRGLVITFVSDILFDSGKAVLRSEALAGLDKVARVLNENVPDLKVGVEGHTDNVPISVSSWKSNWELSVARALSVLHYLQEEKKVSASRLTAIGHGEYAPVADNATAVGRQKNRRVEIVIMPKIPRVKQGQAAQTGGGEPHYK